MSAVLGGRKHPKQGAPPTLGCDGHPCSEGEVLPGWLAGSGGAVGGCWSQAATLPIKVALPLPAGRSGVMLLLWGLLRLLSTAGWREDGSGRQVQCSTPTILHPLPSSQASHLGDPLFFKLGQTSLHPSHKLHLFPGGSSQPHQAAGEEELWRWERLDHPGKPVVLASVVSALCQPWLSQLPRLFC